MSFKSVAALLVVLGVCQNVVTAARPRSACQSCVTGFANMHNRFTALNGSQEAQRNACDGLPLQQQESCQTVLKAALPAFETLLQRPVQVRPNQTKADKLFLDCEGN